MGRSEQRPVAAFELERGILSNGLLPSSRHSETSHSCRPVFFLVFFSSPFLTPSLGKLGRRLTCDKPGHFLIYGRCASGSRARSPASKICLTFFTKDVLHTDVTAHTTTNTHMLTHMRARAGAFHPLDKGIKLLEV